MKKFRIALKDLVWTAVFATAFAVSSIVLAFWGNTDLVIAFGLASVASATLASRDTK